MYTIALPPNSNLIVKANDKVVADATTVVLHDTAAVAAKVTASNTSANVMLAKLIEDKQVWEINAYKASMIFEDLKGMRLSECLSLRKTTNAMSSLREAWALLPGTKTRNIIARMNHLSVKR